MIHSSTCSRSCMPGHLTKDLSLIRMLLVIFMLMIKRVSTYEEKTKIVISNCGSLQRTLYDSEYLDGYQVDKVCDVRNWNS